MLAYIARRLVLIVPTLFGIMVVNFAIVQVAPGGPVDQVIAQIRGAGGGALSRIAGSATGETGSSGDSRAARGIEPALIKELEKQFGFDKPPLERFGLMLWNYARFDFGNSITRNRPVSDLIAQGFPVTAQLGIQALVLALLVSARSRPRIMRRPRAIT